MKTFIFTLFFNILLCGNNNITPTDLPPAPTDTVYDTSSEYTVEGIPAEKPANAQMYPDTCDYLTDEEYSAYPEATFSVNSTENVPVKTGNRIFSLVMIGIFSIIAMSGIAVLLIRHLRMRDY